MDLDEALDELSMSNVKEEIECLIDHLNNAESSEKITDLKANLIEIKKSAEAIAVHASEFIRQMEGK